MRIYFSRKTDELTKFVIFEIIIRSNSRLSLTYVQYFFLLSARNNKEVTILSSKMGSIIGLYITEHHAYKLKEMQMSYLSPDGNKQFRIHTRSIKPGTTDDIIYFRD
jgi:hypothetical protein